VKPIIISRPTNLNLLNKFRYITLVGAAREQRIFKIPVGMKCETSYISHGLH
jgi:hypothetical protein